MKIVVLPAFRLTTPEVHAVQQSQHSETGLVMRRIGIPFLVILACLPLALLALGLPLPGLSRGAMTAKPQPVPDGDRELAWIHTTTNATTWERFVTGVQRVRIAEPEILVDDSRAYLDQVNDVPEVVISRAGRSGKLRIRWYKLSNEATSRDWVRALANRDPAPLAFIGGGSSDRAKDLARALNEQTDWIGERPLLFITTATADHVSDDSDSDRDPPAPSSTRPLVEVYPGRTFRFCFTNQQMARAVIDFVSRQPDLTPCWSGGPVLAAAGSGLASLAGPRPHVVSLSWDDDPYSVDLRHQLLAASHELLATPLTPVNFQTTTAPPFSIGGFMTPNKYESRAVQFVLDELERNPDRRTLLILPTVAPTARRVLRTICELSPLASRRLVVVNGDGIAVNTLYRDGGYAWSGSVLTVPMVLFTHADPVAWDDRNIQPPPGYELLPPTSTEDVLHFSEIARIAIESAYAGDPGGAIVGQPSAYASAIRATFPAVFKADGNRAGGSGEYVVVVRPRDQVQPTQLEIWSHPAGRSWALRHMLVLPWRPFDAGRIAR